MVLNKPFKSDVKGKKYSVYVKSGNKIKKINFGAEGYEDYTQHKDKERRRLFRLRHNCDPVSELKKDTARFWSCEYLWGKD